MKSAVMNFPKKNTFRVAARAVGFIVLLTFSLHTFADQTAEGEYRIAAGDRIRVVVFGHEDLSGEFEVDGSGNFSLPLIRLVEAANLTTTELESEISNRLKPDYLKNPRISVEVIGYRPIYVLGEVREPGSYPYTANLTVVNAIALAGGYTYRASKRKIVIIEASDPERKKRRIDENEKLSPGDVIEVPERFF